MLAVIGGVIALPIPVGAQKSELPVIGYLTSAMALGDALAAWRRGLNEMGYVENRNAAVEFRDGRGDYGLLSEMAADLVSRGVVVIVAGGPPAARAARAATTTIPIVFVIGADPVAAGLVDTIARPGGNMTGFTTITAPLGQKRLELLLELVPKARGLAILINPSNRDSMADIAPAEAAARAYGIELRRWNAANAAEISAAFGSLAEQRADALLVGSDPNFTGQRDQIVALAARHRIPAVYPFREFTASGGLISYGASLADTYRQAGEYVGRILKGTKPADLPVVQPTTFEVIINLKTAKALGLKVPQSLLARADEVIE